MSVMDKIKSMMKSHPHQSEKAVDKGADHVNEKTQGKYGGQVDTAEEKAKDQFRGNQDQNPPPPR